MFQNSYCRVQRQLSFYPSNSKIITYEDSQQRSAGSREYTGYAPRAPKHRMIIFQPTIS
ncbi:hypothetical protein P692DRAFT_20830914 [Suillus brevipes Sb2]|nr:hypothetical protein P692DRAFT_20830914 [Suillus brevipes Sb2]